MPSVTVHIDRSATLPIPDRRLVEKWTRGYDERGAEFAGHAPHVIRAGHYQRVELNTQSGDLTFRCEDWRNPDEPRIGSEAKEPRTLFSATGGPYQWLRAVPARLYWIIDSGVQQRPYLTANDAADFLPRLAPLAQRLIDNLLPVTGTGDLVFSPLSASAGLDIERACSRYLLPPQGPRPFFINLDQVVEVLPELVNPEWTTATDERLDREAEMLTRFLTGRYPRLPHLLGVPEHAGRLEILGARAWLYQFRHLAASTAPDRVTS